MLNINNVYVMFFTHIFRNHVRSCSHYVTSIHPLPKHILPAADNRTTVRKFHLTLHQRINKTIYLSFSAGTVRPTNASQGVNFRKN